MSGILPHVDAVRFDGYCQQCRWKFVLIIADPQPHPPHWIVARIKAEGAKTLTLWKELHAKTCMGSLIVPGSMPPEMP